MMGFLVSVKYMAKRPTVLVGIFSLDTILLSFGGGGEKVVVRGSGDGGGGGKGTDG